MTPVAELLGSLGLSEYADRFAENHIDLSILRDLTDQDLKDLGVALGDRRRMLRAIAELAGTASATPQPTARPESKPPDAAERRQVTVMFSDLVGSTALSARMDPEDLQEVISAYQKCVAETVRHLGGFVARYLGDGVLVYFGYPQAHEDDAERAVKAGLTLIAALARLKTPAPQQIRVGVATGLVVVGHLIQSGESEERSVVGETPNLAARLQGIAEPNMLVIAESTRRLLGNLFKLEDLGIRDLKGIAGPVQAWAVSATGRFRGPLRGAAPDRPASPCRAGGRIRRAGSALAHGKNRRRPAGAALRRGRYRKITPHRRLSGARHWRVAHTLALFLFPAAHRQRALSDYRPDGTCRRAGA
jgi:class 3 adenylate cyclase